jgi:hypothetical protein
LASLMVQIGFYVWWLGSLRKVHEKSTKSLRQL